MRQDALWTFDAISAEGHYEVPLRYRKFEEKGFKTPSGKIELYSTVLERLGYSPLPLYQEPPESPISRPDLVEEFPLVLTTGARVRYFFLSEGRQIERLRKAHRDPLADIHPETARRSSASRTATGYGSKARAAAESSRRRCVEGMHKDTVAIVVGWWFRGKRWRNGYLQVRLPC
ncbi:MAG: hypothetical protein R3D52_03360 [Xanthobacteraceae bacterium]